jgi:hypothetical protein
MLLVHFRHNPGLINRVVDVVLGIHFVGFHNDEGRFMAPADPAEYHSLCDVFVPQTEHIITMFTAPPPKALCGESMR